MGTGSAVIPCSSSDLPDHHPRGHLRQIQAGGLRDERHGSRGAGVDLQDVDLALLDGELDVHQAADVQRLGQRVGLLLEPRDDLGRQAERRDGAGGVARVDARLLDVLHDAADDCPGAVADGVDVDLAGVLEELVDQDGVLGAGLDRLGHVPRQARLVVDDLHGAAAEDEAGPDDDRVADPLGDPPRLVVVGRRVAGRLSQAEPVDDQAEPLAVLGQVDALGAGADDRHAGRLQRPRQVQRRLAAELDDHPDRPDPLADVEHVLDRQRLEEEPVRGVVVGADGLGVRVDHDDLEAVGPQREGGLAAAVVELDPLADPVRPAAEDDHPRPVADPRLVLVLVGRVIVGRDRLELGGAGVDQLEDGVHAAALAVAADLALADVPEVRELPVGEAVPLGLAEQGVVDVAPGRWPRAAGPPARPARGGWQGTRGRSRSTCGSGRSTGQPAARSGCTRPARCLEWPASP